MTVHKPVHPDVSDILVRKQRGREKLAQLSFGEKIRILEAMRKRDEMFARLRDGRTKAAEQNALRR